MQPPFPDDVSLDRGLVDLLGFRFDELTADAVSLRWTVDERHLQPFGLVHGGTYCAAVETAASVAAQLWYGDRGACVGVANSTDFFRPVRAGELCARATPLHRGSTQQVWVVEVTDEQGRLVARGQLRVQNLPHRSPTGGGPAASSSH